MHAVSLRFRTTRISVSSGIDSVRCQVSDQHLALSYAEQYISDSVGHTSILVGVVHTINVTTNFICFAGNVSRHKLDQ
jgi:hypothetical protein